MHDVVVEPIPDLNPEVVGLGDDGRLGDARAPHREVRRGQRRRLDDDGKRHRIVPDDRAVDRDPQRVRTSLCRSKRKPVQAVEHVRHTDHNLLPAVLVDVAVRAVQPSRDGHLRRRVPVVPGVVAERIARVHHEPLRLTRDERVVPHGAGWIVPHDAAVGVVHERLRRHRAGRGDDKRERRAGDVRPAESHAECIRRHDPVNVVLDPVSSPLHFVPAFVNHLHRGGNPALGGAVGTEGPEAVSTRRDGDVERIVHEVDVLRHAVDVERFDRESIGFTRDAADDVCEPALDVAVNLRLFHVRRARVRDRGCHGEVERGVLDVRRADLNLQSLVRTRHRRLKLEGVRAVGVVCHRRVHRDRVQHELRGHHVPTHGTRASKLVARGERERREFPGDGG